MKQALKLIVKDGREYYRYLKYKKTLPKNPKHDDIYIVEFPKSGVTWLQHIIGNIELKLLDKNEYITFYNHHKYLPDVHQLRNSKINRFLNRTFIKTHAKFNPYYYFVIYLIRNPFDVMVSYYNFMGEQGYESCFELFVKDENYGIYAWKRHVNSWFYKKVMAQRIHLLKYENLLNNAKNEVKSMYANLGVDLSEDVVEFGIKQSALEFMQRSENHYKMYNPNYNMSFVGKNNKKSKSELMTTEIRQFIKDVAKEELQYFYPELIM
ncbi:MAG: sulfotransferase domain-containing protein [Flexistipes sinusarabici]|uniref:Sulfotransferase domain-containing protein n=1 Tax=Flexistipes sinusarabici TaxID=2352 RepID=A0A5D0MPJ2_FLESI|nr:sulfotransferase domain-containing protein [Flexistipes sinusarabici]TYB33441.1 MAG: sulfotransferase domain-containing protein [Flexistipes sinusarabici]